MLCHDDFRWPGDTQEIVHQTAQAELETYSSPIYSLPTELLLEILRYCHFPWTPDPYHFDIRLANGIRYPVNHYRLWLQEVCSLWRHCIVGTPYFWSSMNTNAHLASDVFAESLHRSAEALLEVSLANASHLVPLLHDHVHRIQRLSIDCLCNVTPGETDFDAYASLFTLKAPFLRYFRLLLRLQPPSWAFVDLGSVRDRVALPTLFDGSPSLTHIYLRHCLPWPANSFPRLTHLSLGCISPHESRPQDCAAFLAGSPILEELIIEHAEFAVSFHADRRIPLPRLRLVVLVDCYEPLLDSMLRAVIPSENATLGLRWSFHPPVRNGIWSDIFRPDSAFFSHVQSVDEFCLWSSENTCKELTFRCDDVDSQSSLTFNMQMGTETAEPQEQDIIDNMFRALPFTFHLSAVKLLRIQLSEHFTVIFANPLPTLLRLMPDIEDLIVFLYETVDEEAAIALLRHGLPTALLTVSVAKRYSGELPSTWMPMATLQAVINQALNGGTHMHRLTCSTISPIPHARPFYGLGWEPEDVIVEDVRVMDFVDELVLDCVDYDKDLLDHPKIELWDRRETIF